MALDSLSRLVLLLAVIIPINADIVFLPAKAKSALAAWLINNDGILLFRTSMGANPKAFFQDATDGKGDRVWIDFSGELSRIRSFNGTGPISEIRLGKPSKGITRFVVEFKPSVSLDPSKLKLIGTAPDKWQLKFTDIPINGLKRIGEGEINYNSNKNWTTKSSTKNFYLNINDLPNITRNRFLVIIDPGHGGPDSGAVGLGGLKESNVVLDISLKVAEILEIKGVKVKLTRSKEMDLDLPPRVAMANKSRADAFVSIHANASRNKSKSINGIETFYAGSKGYMLSKAIQKELLKVSSGSPDRGVRRSRFFVIRTTSMPAALVETGFITGSIDAPRLGDESHRKQVALAISNGIIKYLKGIN